MYALFSGSNYYPMGGWCDYKGVFDTVQEAEDFAVAEIATAENSGDPRTDWWEIVDLRTPERGIIKHWGSRPSEDLD